MAKRKEVFKWHITPEGVKPCEASYISCKYGDAKHFKDFQSARSRWEYGEKPALEVERHNKLVDDSEKPPAKETVYVETSIKRSSIRRFGDEIEEYQQQKNESPRYFLLKSTNFFTNQDNEKLEIKITPFVQYTTKGTRRHNKLRADFNFYDYLESKKPSFESKPFKTWRAEMSFDKPIAENDDLFLKTLNEKLLEHGCPDEVFWEKQQEYSEHYHQLAKVIANETLTVSKSYSLGYTYFDDIFNDDKLHAEVDYDTTAFRAEHIAKALNTGHYLKIENPKVSVNISKKGLLDRGWALNRDGNTGQWSIVGFGENDTDVYPLTEPNEVKYYMSRIADEKLSVTAQKDSEKLGNFCEKFIIDTENILKKHKEEVIRLAQRNKEYENASQPNEKIVNSFFKKIFGK